MDGVGAVLSTVLWEAGPINFAECQWFRALNQCYSVVISVPHCTHLLNGGGISRLSVCQFSPQTVELPKITNSGKALKAGHRSGCGRIQAKTQVELSVLWGRKLLILMPEKGR